MSIFSYHLVKTNFFSGLKLMLFPPKAKNTPGLIHAETMMAMTLGSAILSPSRFLVRELVFFAQWENQEAIDHFLNQKSNAKTWAKGWHIRLSFLRQWGKISGFVISKENIADYETKQKAVVAVTLAKMKFLQVPRFIKWGRPVEKLVRDHPGTTLSLASVQLPNMVSTFSIWKSAAEMTNMVHGHSAVKDPERHKNAMIERERKDFHFEFTTLRFSPIAEFGEWKSCQNHLNF